MSDLVIIRAEDSAETCRKIEGEPGPVIIPAGGAVRGAKRVRMPSGAIIEACGGELLKSALRNGGVIIGDAPVSLQRGPSVTDQKNATITDLRDRTAAVTANYHR